MKSHTKESKHPSIWFSILPIAVLVLLLVFNVRIFEDALGGPNQLALLAASFVAAVIGIRYGFKWEAIQKGMVQSIKSALPAILILLLIGALAGSWLISGIVPTMIYYGLNLLNPTFFLVAACVVCAIVSLATGSSWSTIATVGVALLGIGTALGIGQGLVAGAIISGAYFGDKMSPLSDTTNLAPAMAGTDLITHIRYMVWTTVPTLLITLIIYLVIGFTVETQEMGNGVEVMLKALDEKFYISPLLFIVPLAVVYLIVKKVSALPALFIGTLLGVVAAVLTQPAVIGEISGSGNSSLESSYKAVLLTLSGEVSLSTGIPELDDLLSTGGMAGMLNTIWLIVCAMCFGGVMEACGMLQRITSTVIKLAKSTGSLIATTAGTCIFFNATASDQYLAIVVPGRMFASTYADRGLAPENLSRTLEDSGTVTSVLFPWNTCGAAQASVLNVATGEYWMYAFFNLISPLMTVFYGFFNIKIARLKKA